MSSRPRLLTAIPLKPVTKKQDGRGALSRSCLFRKGQGSSPRSPSMSVQQVLLGQFGTMRNTIFNFYFAKQARIEGKAISLN